MQKNKPRLNIPEPTLRRAAAQQWLMAAACLVPSICAFGGDPVFYHFEEGEPLVYQLDLTATNSVSTESHFFSGLDKSHHKNVALAKVGYQLMPIARGEDGAWKIRVVLDQVEQTQGRDGELKTETFDRTALRRALVSPGELLHASWDNPVPISVFSGTNRATPAAQPTQLQDPTELFEQPILAWLMPNGTLLRFEDRPELKQLLPNIDLKKCFELVIPPLLASSMVEGCTWSRELPVDLPEPPLPGNTCPPMALKVIYTLGKTQTIKGARCVLITMHGTFSRDGLSIPIHEQEMNYLIWTTSITKIEDQIEGEFVYDPERQVAMLSEIRSTYRYGSLAGRKVDHYRGRIVSESVMHTRLVNRLVPVATAEAQAARN